MGLDRFRWEAPRDFDALRDRLRKTTDPEVLRDTYLKIIKRQPVLNYKIGRGSVYWRGRVAPTAAGWPNKRDVGPPPADNCVAQRLNDAGMPVFYGATRVHTVLRELGVTRGQYVHLIGIRMLPKVAFRIAAIGDLFHAFKVGYSKVIGTSTEIPLPRLLNTWGREESRRIVYTDALLGSTLADENANRDGYLHTRAIANAVFDKGLGIEAFFYPSVRLEAGMNIAIRAGAFTTKTHIVCSQVIHILGYREPGLFDFEVCGHATWIDDETGDFIWGSEDTLECQLLLFGLTNREVACVKGKGGELSGNDYLEIMNLGSAR